MATLGRLRRPPIQEALVDLRITSTTSIGAAVLEPLQEEFRTHYPKFEWRRKLEARQVADFLTRVTAYVDAPIEATAIITQRLEHATEQPTPFVLDIDVFQEREFGVDADVLEPLLQHLREIKNRLFFSFLTDEALEPHR